MENIVALDNNGETFDRYTIINTEDGEMIGSSDEPFHPQGFGQHCGNLVDFAMVTTHGSQWRKYVTDEKKIIKQKVKEYLSDTTTIGKQIPFDSLPEAVQKFAKQSFL